MSLPAAGVEEGSLRENSRQDAASPIGAAPPRSAQSSRSDTASTGERIDLATIVLLTVPPLLWAGNAVVGRMAIDIVPPLLLNLLRWSTALIILLPFAWRALAAHRGELRAHWRILFLLGVLGVGVYNSLQYLGLHTSTPINLTLIAASGPVFALAIGVLFFGEAITPRQAFGAALSLAGVVCVLLRGDALRLANIDFALGDVYMLVATASWALYTWLLRRRPPPVPPLALMAATMFFGIVGSLPFAVAEHVFGSQATAWDHRLLLVLAYVAVLPSLVALFCWNRGVARAGAQLPMVFANLTPVFTAVISAALLAEPPRLYHLAALALIILGIRFAMPR